MLPFDSVNDERNLEIVNILSSSADSALRSERSHQSSAEMQDKALNFFEDLRDELEDIADSLISSQGFIGGLLVDMVQELKNLADNNEKQNKANRKKAEKERDAADAADDVSDDTGDTTGAKIFNKEKFKDNGLVGAIDWKSLAGAIFGGTVIGGLTKSVAEFFKRGFTAFPWKKILGSIGRNLSKILFRALLPIAAIGTMILGFFEGYLSSEKTDILGKIRDGLLKGIGQLVELLSFGFIKEGEFTKAIDNISAIFSDFIWEISEGISELYNGIVDWVSENIFGKGFAALESIGNFGKWLWGKIAEGYTAAVDWVSENIFGKGFAALESIGNFGKWVSEKINKVYQGAIDWVSDKIFGKSFADHLKTISSFGKWVSEKIVEGYNAVVDWVSDKIFGKNFTALESISSFGEWLWEKINKVYQDAIDLVSDKIFGINSAATPSVDDKNLMPDFSELNAANIVSNIIAQIGEVLAGAMSSIAQFIYESGKDTWGLKGITRSTASAFSSASRYIGDSLGATNYDKFIVPEDGDIEPHMIKALKPPVEADTNLDAVTSSQQSSSGNVIVTDASVSTQNNVMGGNNGPGSIPGSRPGSAISAPDALTALGY